MEVPGTDAELDHGKRPKGGFTTFGLQSRPRQHCQGLNPPLPGRCRLAPELGVPPAWAQSHESQARWHGPLSWWKSGSG